MEITKFFLTGRPDAGGVSGDYIIAVGVEGKQLWKEITLNLKHALDKLFGKPPRNVYGYQKENYKPYVLPLEEGVYTWGGNKIQTQFEVFAHWQKYKMHTRIILRKNGTFIIRKPGR
jgi:hypothetical protein